MVIYQKLLPQTKKRGVFYLSLKISSLNRLASYDEYPPVEPVGLMYLFTFVLCIHMFWGLVDVLLVYVMVNINIYVFPFLLLFVFTCSGGTRKQICLDQMAQFV